MDHVNPSNAQEPFQFNYSCFNRIWTLCFDRTYDLIIDRIMRCTSSILINWYRTWFDSLCFDTMISITLWSSMFCYYYRIGLYGLSIGTTRLRHHVGLITRLGVFDFCQLAWILSVPSMAPVVCLFATIVRLPVHISGIGSVLVTSVIRRCSCVGCHMFSLIILYCIISMLL